MCGRRNRRTIRRRLRRATNAIVRSFIPVAVLVDALSTILHQFGVPPFRAVAIAAMGTTLLFITMLAAASRVCLEYMGRPAAAAAAAAAASAVVNLTTQSNLTNSSSPTGTLLLPVPAPNHIIHVEYDLNDNAFSAIHGIYVSCKLLFVSINVLVGAVIKAINVFPSLSFIVIVLVSVIVTLI
jgi:hypothetical protein